MAGVMDLGNDKASESKENNNVEVNGTALQSTQQKEQKQAGEEAEGKVVEKDDVKYVTLDGPLSNMMTAALNAALSTQKVELSTSQEDQAIDSTIYKTLHEEAEAIKDQKKLQESGGLYVYVTDADELDNGDNAKSLDSLRVALSTESYSKVILCVNSRNKFARGQASLESFVVRNGGKVCYGLEKLKSLILG